MIILTLRTDKPEAEIGLYDDHTQIVYETRTAHRQLAEGLHLKIKDVLSSHHIKLELVQALVVFMGPGSFTGLRIGLSVSNALAYGLAIPIVGEIEEREDDWRVSGINRVLAGADDRVVVPEYGSPVHITPAKST